MRIAVLMLPLFMLFLTGCGVKPNQVDPPAGVEKGKDYFPRTYPDTSTDPNPQRYVPK
jgi:hypothetical protein